MLQTKRLKLIPFDEPHFDILLRNDMTLLGRLLDIETPKTWTTFDDMNEALPSILQTYRLNGSTWGGYFIIEKMDRQLLGTCGFKGSPDSGEEKGIVEIGYEIHTDYRLRGLATEVARCLVTFAFQDARVNIVCAHTLADTTPSVSVLKKIGFRFAGQFFNPDDGDIWRWEVVREGFIAA
ncbi:MAG: GNAT family N-acetyltransferase [Saprospiraceae bacterium]|nr:GNAT family N-acetyltransferase [Saprospiraceae bacterium]